MLERGKKKRVKPIFLLKRRQYFCSIDVFARKKLIEKQIRFSNGGGVLVPLMEVFLSRGVLFKKIQEKEGIRKKKKKKKKALIILEQRQDNILPM